MAKGSGGGGGTQDRNVYGTIGNDILGTRDRGTTFGFAGNDTITGAAGFDSIHAGDGNDRVIAGAGDDRVWGGLGDDVLDGGTGSDWVNYNNVDFGVPNSGTGATSGVTVNLNITTAQNTSGAGIDTIIGFENIGGSDFADVLTGLANQTSSISGWGGNDRILGGNAADVFYGGDGDDTVDGGAGTDHLEGNNGNDRLLGGAGDDYLRPDGDASPNIIGNDFVDGGLGVDGISYYGDTFAGVTVNLSLTTAQNTGGGGIETILNVENVQGTTFNDTITGNSANNFLWGGGGQGVDTLFGLGGNDNLQADFGTADGGDGNDLVIGGTRAIGGNGDDDVRGAIADGGAGNDKLTGTTMTGGLGIDTFNVLGIGDSTITDFTRAQGDKIDLHNLPLNFQVGPLNYVGYAPFTSFAGHPEVRVVAGVGVQNVEFDINGDRVADMTIHVNGTTPLVASDFILV